MHLGRFLERPFCCVLDRRAVRRLNGVPVAAFVRGAALLDVPTGDPQWLDRSAGQRDACATGAGLCINPTVHAEASGGFERIGELDDALPSDIVTRLDLPWEAAC